MAPSARATLSGWLLISTRSPRGSREAFGSLAAPSLELPHDAVPTSSPMATSAGHFTSAASFSARFARSSSPASPVASASARMDWAVRSAIANAPAPSPAWYSSHAFRAPIAKFVRATALRTPGDEYQGTAEPSNRESSEPLTTLPSGILYERDVVASESPGCGVPEMRATIAPLRLDRNTVATVLDAVAAPGSTPGMP